METLDSWHTAGHPGGFWGYIFLAQVTCGITFTFGGIRVNTTGEVLNQDGEAIRGLYAAGEMAGGIFYENYPGGSGLMSGAVFGKLAGAAAAGYSLEKRKDAVS